MFVVYSLSICSMGKPLGLQALALSLFFLTLVLVRTWASGEVMKGEDVAQWAANILGVSRRKVEETLHGRISE